MTRFRLLSVVTTALALLLALSVHGCSSNGDDDDEAEPPPTSESSTSSTTATTGPTSSSTSPEPPWSPVDVFPTGEEAMTRLVEAWRAGDRVTASRVAPPDAVASLFSVAADGYAPYQQCGDADFGQQLCAYRNRDQGGFVQFQMEQQENGWYVISVAVDPTG